MEVGSCVKCAETFSACGCGSKAAERYEAYEDPISDRQEYKIDELGGKVDKSMTRSEASDYIKELQGRESGTWRAEDWRTRLNVCNSCGFSDYDDEVVWRIDGMCRNCKSMSGAESFGAEDSQKMEVNFKIQDADYATFYYTTDVPSELRRDEDIVSYVWGDECDPQDDDWFYCPYDWNGVGQHYLAKVMNKTLKAESFGAESYEFHTAPFKTTIQVSMGSPSGSTESYTRIFNLNVRGYDEDLEQLTRELERLLNRRVEDWNESFRGESFGAEGKGRYKYKELTLENLVRSCRTDYNDAVLDMIESASDLVILDEEDLSMYGIDEDDIRTVGEYYQGYIDGANISRQKKPHLYKDQKRKWWDWKAESFGAESKFDKLAKEIAEEYEEKGKSPKEAMEIGEATAAKIGRAKFGKKKFAKMGQKAEDDIDFDEAKADRNKDGRISDWERAVGNAVAKGIRDHKGAEVGPHVPTRIGATTTPRGVVKTYTSIPAGDGHVVGQFTPDMDYAPSGVYGAESITDSIAKGFGSVLGIMSGLIIGGFAMNAVSKLSSDDEN